MQSVYFMDGELWGTADGGLVDSLGAEGLVQAVVLPDTDTEFLFVVRFPDTIDLSMAAQVGEVLDQSGRSVIVRASTIPPHIAELTNVGIAVEKLPPPQSAGPNRSELASLESADPLLRSVSEDELVKTISDLQEMGATDGGLGSRQQPSAGNVMAADYIFRRLSSYGLSVRYDDFLAGDGTYATNVIGELPGDDPSEIFLVVAHYDSFSDEGGPSPGADDNASGVAGMLEVARVLSGFRLPYSVWFIAFTGEEIGFQGSLTFTRQAMDPAMVGAFNLDAIGWPGRSTELVINGDANSEWMQDYFIEANERFGFGQQLTVRQNELIVADDNVLRDAGIPTVLIARAVYGDSAIHHTANDVLANLDIHAVSDATALTLVSLGLLMTE